MWEGTEACEYKRTLQRTETHKGGEKRMQTWTRHKRKGFDRMGVRVNRDPGPSKREQPPYFREATSSRLYYSYLDILPVLPVLPLILILIAPMIL